MQTAPVIIVGAGPTGLCASILLSRHGVPSLVIERHPGTSIHPKATGISTRTMELFRSWGIDATVRERGLAVGAVSPVEATVCAQDRLEPILLDYARRYRVAEVRFDTELADFQQYGDGVDLTLVDRPTGVSSHARARYIIAADGAGSPVRTKLGIRMIGIERVEGAEVFDVGAQVADRFRAGRIFLAGDAAHRMTPAGAAGMNTAIHDVHNLAWKLAAVIQGWGEDPLLETYEAERRPVAERNVARSIGPWRDVSLAALDLGAAYSSSAVVSDGPMMTSMMPDLTAPAWPGCRAPHVWLERGGRRISTHDLWRERFVLLAGDGPVGDAWAACAYSVARDLTLPFAAFTIGRGGDLHDHDATWHEAYGIESDGAVLIRPDGHIAWRSRRSVANPIAQLTIAMSQILSRETIAAALQVAS